MKKIFKKLEYRFLFESTKIESAKVKSQKSVLRQVKWGVQNGRITKNRVLPVIILFF